MSDAADLTEETQRMMARWAIRAGLGQLFLEQHPGRMFSRREFEKLTAAEFSPEENPLHHDLYERLSTYATEHEPDDEDDEHGIDHSISRLHEALEIQQDTEGEIVSTPVVVYCFDCDEITVDSLKPDRCIDHNTVSSDGYEHAGIEAAITALRTIDAVAESEADDE